MTTRLEEPAHVLFENNEQIVYGCFGAQVVYSVRNRLHGSHKELYSVVFKGTHI